MNRYDFIAKVKKAIKKAWKPEREPDVYIGVDWGGGHDATSVCVLSNVPNADFNVEHRRLHNMNFQEQVEVINSMIATYKPKSVVVDIGAGMVPTQMLQQRHGDLVKSCYYAAAHRNRISYDVATFMLSVDRDAFLSESRRLASNLADNDQHSLNYAYIAWSTKNTRSVHENPVRPF